MEQLSIFSATLGLSMPWQVTEVTFEKESNRLHISVAYALRDPLVCPVCGAHGTTSPKESVDEIWYHNDFFHYATYLHAQVPQLTCSCGSRTLERPWCRAGSKFAKLP